MPVRAPVSSAGRGATPAGVARIGRGDAPHRATSSGPFNHFYDRDNDGLEDTLGISLEDWRALSEQQRTQMHEQAAAAQGRADYAEYIESGQRQRDLDAGRTPMDASGRGTVGEVDAGEIPQWVKDTRGIPIIGGPADAWMADYNARKQQNEWDALHSYAPTVNDLAVNYGEEGFIGGPERSELAGATGDAAAMEAERRALANFEDIYGSGGLTSADRARMQLGANEMGRAMRSQREADLSSLRARGMGDSGAALSSMLSAQQGGANMLADREAQMQVAAQDRAMRALENSGSMAGRMRQSGWQEDTTRRGALDDFNRWNTDYSREREQRNQAWRAKTGESLSGARQQVHENRANIVAGKTGQYPGNASNANAIAERNDENAKGVIGALGDVVEEL